MNDEANRQQQSVQADQAVPVMEEELVTGTRRVTTGSVRVRKKVHRLHRTVDIPTVRDVVDVTRRAINQVVTEMPRVREEGDLLIIPVVEEEIVVTKRLVLKEEVYIRRRQERTNATKDVTLGREVATVERLDAEGAVINTSQPAVSTNTVQAEPIRGETVRTETEPLLRSERAPLLTPDPAVQLRVKKGLLD